MSVTSGGPACVFANRQMQFIRHFHNAHQILYVKGGAVKLLVGEHEYIARPNCLMLISRMEEHSIEVLEDEGKYLRYYIELSPEQLNRMIPDPKLRSVFVSRAKNFCHVFDMSADADRVARLFEEMHNNSNTEEPFRNEMLAAQLMQLMIMTYRLHPEQFPQPKKGVSSAIYQVQQYLDEHFAEDCSIADIAKEMFLSPYYLSHAFKEWTGYSPKQYMMLSRISCAKELLFSTELTVSEISTKCGFGDVSNFVRTFKKESGQTPEQYRRSL